MALAWKTKKLAAYYLQIKIIATKIRLLTKDWWFK